MHQKNIKGTALLTALLIMGLLLTVSLLISSLILRENRIVKDLLDSGKAYYAAESGVELSLYGLYNELPGWEPVENGYLIGQVGDKAVMEYRMNNRCATFPCVDEKFSFDLNGDLDEELAQSFYYALDLNQTISLPLFVVDESGADTLEVEDFTVEFFSPLNVREHLDLELNPDKIKGWDILRWKIMGFEKGSADVTETISDFTAISNGTNAVGPSWFGTKSCDQLGDRLVPGIICQAYAVQDVKEIVNEDGSTTFSGICLNTEAREFYDYSGGRDDRIINEESIARCYPIKQFLNDHELNYLTLTNLFNPAVLKSELPADMKEALSKLYIRVELFGSEEGGNKTVAEFAEIESSGYSGDTKQSLNVYVRRDSFMPVFNFSLYSTYGNE